jgi:uncharacterized protein
VSLSLYEISVPVLITGLQRMSRFLDHGRRLAEEKGFTEDTVLTARIAPDMMPLIAQVQRASDTAKFVAVRIGRVQNRVMADHEKTFLEAQARIANTVEFLREVQASSFEGRERDEIIVPAPSGDHVFTAQAYVLEFALPNFFFHVTTAYNVLRHLGTPVGKRHFLGWE